MTYNPALWTCALVSLVVLPWAGWALWKESRDQTLRATYGSGFWVSRLVVEGVLVVTSGWFLWLAGVAIVGGKM
jgi:hypothetical protein